jgi:hypothetical protein
MISDPCKHIHKMMKCNNVECKSPRREKGKKDVGKFQHMLMNAMQEENTKFTQSLHHKMHCSSNIFPFLQYHVTGWHCRISRVSVAVFFSHTGNQLLCASRKIL